MWIHAKLTLKSQRRVEIAGEYRAILELAKATREAFSGSGKDPDQLSDAEIWKYIRVTLKGGTIPNYSQPPQSKSPLYDEVAEWWKEPEKWWILALLVTGGSIAPISLHGPWVLSGFVSGLLAGLFFSILVGSTHKSRCLITFVLSFVLAGCFIPIFGSKLSEDRVVRNIVIPKEFVQALRYFH